TRGFLTTGFLAFGDGAAGEKLAHCGARFKTKKAMIVEGDLAEPAKSTGQDVVAAIGDVVKLTVKVDLEANRVTLTAGDVAVEADLKRALKTITHIGFSTDGAVAEFSPLEVVSR
ncbi:MAG: hypothetical protein HQ582_22515, partial [Planctomycetes bacterium]|nr:hypothetical protein [Planctomycetota bacterium]